MASRKQTSEDRRAKPLPPSFSPANPFGLYTAMINSSDTHKNVYKSLNKTVAALVAPLPSSIGRHLGNGAGSVRPPKEPRAQFQEPHEHTPRNNRISQPRVKAPVQPVPYHDTKSTIKPSQRSSAPPISPAKADPPQQIQTRNRHAYPPVSPEVDLPRRVQQRSPSPVKATVYKGDNNTCVGRTCKGKPCKIGVKTQRKKNRVPSHIDLYCAYHEHQKPVPERVRSPTPELAIPYGRGNTPDPWTQRAKLRSSRRPDMGERAVPRKSPIDFATWIPTHLQWGTKEKLQALMKNEPAKFDSDHEGYIYCYEIYDPENPHLIHLKIGRSVDVRRRIREWTKSCPSKKPILRRWECGPSGGYERDIIGWKCKNYMRAEALIHSELRDVSLNSTYISPSNIASKYKRRNASSVLEEPGSPCKDCGVTHQEVFTFIRPESGRYKDRVWEDVVQPIIEKWGRFVDECT